MSILYSTGINRNDQRLQGSQMRTNIEDEIYMTLTNYTDIEPSEAIEIIRLYQTDIAVLEESISERIDMLSCRLRDEYKRNMKCK